MICIADVSDTEQVEKAVQSVEEAFKYIHTVFNDEEYPEDFTQVQNYQPDDFVKVLKTNVKGLFKVYKATSKHMIKNGIKGFIVNSAYKDASICPSKKSAYEAYRNTIWSMSKSARKELAKHEIRVGRSWVYQVKLD